MKSPSRLATLIGMALALAAVAYLLPFVTRGWVALDEGMLGQVAERVLRGELPHVDFEDPYSGGLSWIYAGLFRLTGIELTHIRWFFFLGTSLATFTLYDLCRRAIGPIGAGIATAVGVTWAFPNYFAGLPSWWLLICGLAALWATLRHQDTGQLRYLALAGLAAGLAVAIKQTGVYLCVALLLALLFDSAPIAGNRSVDRVLRFTVATGTLLFAFVIVRRGLHLAEAIYLLPPVTACAAALALSNNGSNGPLLLRRGIVLSAAAGIPVLALLVPYIVSGHVGDFVNGVFVEPQTRFSLASYSMPPAQLIILGLPVAALILPLSVWKRPLLPFRIAIWIVSFAAVILAVRSEIVYQLVWQSTRAVTAILPVAICWHLRSVDDRAHRRRLFLSASVLAWLSLNQSPYAAPVYFCYVAPIAVFAAVTLSTAGPGPVSPGLLPWAIGLTLFAGVSLNTGSLHALGWRSQPVVFDAPLALPRAHLILTSDTVEMYRTLVSVVNEHAAGGRVVALPDCPEVYFLTGHSNLSGNMYDFLDATGTKEREVLAQEQWRQANVFVINDGLTFSTPLSAATLAAVRQEFGAAQMSGHYEIRWRAGQESPSAGAIVSADATSRP